MSVAEWCGPWCRRGDGGRGGGGRCRPPRGGGEPLRAALDGAEALFLIVPGGGLPVGELLDVAKAGGVERIVLVSSQAAGTRPETPAYAPLREIEQAVAQFGPGWTVLRPAGFASNAYAWAASIRAERTVRAPFGDVALPVVDPADIAEVAALVLGEAGHDGRVYELTGPAAVTPREQAAALGDALGAEVRFVEQTPAEARAAMLRFMPEPVVDGTLAVLGAPTERERRPSPDVATLLGRPARSFADWAR